MLFWFTSVCFPWWIVFAGIPVACCVIFCVGVFPLAFLGPRPFWEGSFIFGVVLKQNQNVTFPWLKHCYCRCVLPVAMRVWSRQRFVTGEAVFKKYGLDSAGRLPHLGAITILFNVSLPDLAVVWENDMFAEASDLQGSKYYTILYRPYSLTPLTFNLFCACFSHKPKTPNASDLNSSLGNQVRRDQKAAEPITNSSHLAQPFAQCFALRPVTPPAPRRNKVAELFDFLYPEPRPEGGRLAGALGPGLGFLFPGFCLCRGCVIFGLTYELWAF